MHSHETRALIRRARSIISKRHRDDLHGSLSYLCSSCGAMVRVGVGYGIMAPGSDWHTPVVMRASRLIDCVVSCGGKMVVESDSYSHDVRGIVAYMRVPSRRAAKDMVSDGEARPQVVILRER